MQSSFAVLELVRHSGRAEIRNPGANTQSYYPLGFGFSAIAEPRNDGAVFALLKRGSAKRLATPERVELPTVCLGRSCSIQLSYGASALPS